MTSRDHPESAEATGDAEAAEAPGDAESAGDAEAAARAEVRAARTGWRPWIVMGVVLIGSYLVVLNTTILGVALPQISADLGPGGLLDVDWVITTYLLAVVAVQPATAWFAGRFGHKRVYVTSLAVFALGSLLSALAPTLEALLAARFVQGAGGGALMPLGMSMVLAVFPPHRRGLVLGIRGVAVMAGPALGPPLGGLAVTQGSWRMIFVGLVALGLIAVPLAARLLRDPARREAKPLDTGGWALAFLGVALLVVGARQAGAWGFTAPPTLAALALGLTVLVLLGRRSLRRPHPIIEPRLLTTPTFVVSLLVVWMITVVTFARLNFLPVELQVLRDLSAQDVGLIMAPSAIGVAATMTLGGWLADRVGARGPLLAGLTVMCATTWQLANLTPDTSVWWITGVLLAQGLGTGLMRIPLNVAGINAVPNRLITQASALRSLNRQVASAVGTAVLAALVVAQLGSITPEVTSAEDVAAAQAAYNRVFEVAFGVLLVALTAALAMPGRRRMRELQARRAEEYDAEAS